MKHEGSEGFGRNYAKSVSPCSDPRLHAPAAQRNGEAIRQELHRIHRAGGCILEVASGPGQHVACFADEFSDMRWQPSDPDPRMRASQDAWTHALPNVHKPLDLDVLHVAWWKDAGGPYDAVLCINMLHCTERETIRGLTEGAGNLLVPGGCLLIYGPFSFNGEHIAVSNRNFDRMLRHQNAEWGVRDVNDIAAEADKHGLLFAETIEMPANNSILLLRRR